MIMKKIVTIAVTLVLWLAAYSVLAQDRPDLKKFELLGIDEIDGSAYMIADVVLKKEDAAFKLLVAQAAMYEDGLGLNPNMYALYEVRATCGRNRTFQIVAEQGVRNGTPYKGAKTSKEPVRPGTNIARILVTVCRDKIPAGNYTS
jgi:hypothetical protein